MRQNKFFKEQERTVVFTPIHDENVWAPGIGGPIAVNGLAKISMPGTVLDSGTTIEVSTLVFHMEPAEAEKLRFIQVGWRATYDDITYAVVKIDLRGVLPTEYSCRLEAVLR